MYLNSKNYKMSNKKKKIPAALLTTMHAIVLWMKITRRENQRRISGLYERVSRNELCGSREWVLGSMASRCRWSRVLMVRDRSFVRYRAFVWNSSFVRDFLFVCVFVRLWFVCSLLFIHSFLIVISPVEYWVVRKHFFDQVWLFIRSCLSVCS